MRKARQNQWFVWWREGAVFT